jgi:chemotaxis protein methyltransferase CheR
VQYRADSLGLAGQVTAIFRDLVHERLGLFYEVTQFDQLADRLAPLVVARGMTSFMDYYYLLKYSDDEAEWGRVMDALAVQETYFWRESDQIRAIVDCVVPRLVDELGGSPLKIWTVPCASGEEPLTLAMMLEEAGWFDRAFIDIAGSDASRAAIAKAVTGRYGPRAFRNLPADIRDKYFTADEDGKTWIVNPSLRRRVSYDVVNLVTPDDVARHAAAPIVFCRNLFIYFSDQSISRAVEAIARCMPEQGYLCVGVSESLLRLRTSFELQEIGGAFVYVKGPHATGPLSATAPALRMRGFE